MPNTRVNKLVHLTLPLETVRSSTPTIVELLEDWEGEGRLKSDQQIRIFILQFKILVNWIEMKVRGKTRNIQTQEMIHALRPHWPVELSQAEHGLY